MAETTHQFRPTTEATSNTSDKAPMTTITRSRRVMLRVWWNVLAISSRPDRSPLPATALRLHLEPPETPRAGLVVPGAGATRRSTPNTLSPTP